MSGLRCQVCPSVCSTPSFSRLCTVPRGFPPSLCSCFCLVDRLLLLAVEFKSPGKGKGYLCPAGTAVPPWTAECPACLPHQVGSLTTPALSWEHPMEANFLQSLCSRMLKNRTFPVWVFSLGPIAESASWKLKKKKAKQNNKKTLFLKQDASGQGYPICGLRATCSPRWLWMRLNTKL